MNRHVGSRLNVEDEELRYLTKSYIVGCGREHQARSEVLDDSLVWCAVSGEEQIQYLV